MEQTPILELKYNSILDIIKDYRYVKYKIYMGIFFLFLVSCMVFYASFIENLFIDKTTIYLIYLGIFIPLLISTLYDFYTRRIKIRIYDSSFEIPISKFSTMSNSRRVQRVMTKYKFLKLARTSQYKHTYTLHFVHDIENEDETIKNKTEFTIKSLTHLEISKLERAFKEKLAFTREPYYTRK